MVLADILCFWVVGCECCSRCLEVNKNIALFLSMCARYSCTNRLFILQDSKTGYNTMMMDLLLIADDEWCVYAGRNYTW